MEIRVLGCDGGSLPRYRSVSLLINNSICLDAGTVTSVLSQEEQLKIKHVLLTHAHMDHIHDLHFLIDNRFVSDNSHNEVTLYSTPFILKNIHEHVFNGIIWPDYTKQPGPPILILKPIDDKPFQIGNLKIQAVKVEHTVEALGYIVSDGKVSCVFSGDTKATQKIWEESKKAPHLRAVFLELSYSSRKLDLSHKAKHHCPPTFIEELKKIPKDIAVYAYHLKPHFYNEIIEEIKSKKTKNVTILKSDQVIKI